MAKLERLMKLMELLRNGEALSVEKMSAECGVSQRTVYRYLNILAEIEDRYPLLAAGNHTCVGDHNQGSLSTADWELVVACLINSPLASYGFFADRLRYILRMIDKHQKGSAEQDRPFLFERKGISRRRGRPGESRILRGFSKAIQNSQQILIWTRSNQGEPRVYTPHAIRIRNEGLTLLVKGRSGMRAVEINLADISRVEVVS